MSWDLGQIFDRCTWPVPGECVAEMPCYRHQPQTAALSARSLRRTKISVQSHDMDEHEGIPAFQPTTTSSQANISTETMLKTSIDVPAVVCEAIHEELITLSEGSDHEHDAQSLLEIATGNSPETGSCIGNLPQCQKDIIGRTYRRILRHLPPFTRLAVMLVQPITATAAPTGFNLHMTGKFSFNLSRQFRSC